MKIRQYVLGSNLLLFSLFACETAPTETPISSAPPIVEVPEGPASPIAPPTTGTDWKNNINDFLKEGQVLLQDVEGDVDQDGIPDKVAVIDNPPSAAQKEELSASRTLMIFQGNPQGQYRLAASSDQVVLCAACGGVLGDPFRTLTIKESTIDINQEGGSRERWTRSTAIAWNPTLSDWVLVKDQLTVVDTYDASNNTDKSLLEETPTTLGLYNVYKSQ